MDSIEDLPLEERMKIAEEVAAAEERWPRLKGFWRRVKGPLKVFTAAGLALFGVDESFGDKVTRGFCGELSEFVGTGYDELKAVVDGVLITDADCNMRLIHDHSMHSARRWSVSEDGNTLYLLSVENEELKKHWAEISGERLVLFPDPCLPIGPSGKGTMRYLWNEPWSLMKPGEVDFDMGGISLSPDEKKIAFSIFYYPSEKTAGAKGVDSTRSTIDILEIKSGDVKTTELPFKDESIWTQSCWLGDSLIAAYSVSVDDERETYVFCLKDGELIQLQQFEGALDLLRQSPDKQKFMIRLNDENRPVEESEIIICSLSEEICRTKTIDLTTTSYAHCLGTCFDFRNKGFYFVREKIGYDRVVSAPQQVADLLNIPVLKLEGNLNDFRLRFRVTPKGKGYNLFYKDFESGKEVRVAGLAPYDCWTACNGGVLVVRDEIANKCGAVEAFYKIDFDPEDY